jgi:SAM-dependent methyltransferase
LKPSNLFSGFRAIAENLYHSYFSIPNDSGYDLRCAGLSRENALSLDLGCGKTPKNPFNAKNLYGVDIDYGVDESSNIFPCDLGAEELPFRDSFFDFVTAFDLIEHIPRIGYDGGKRSLPFVHLMNEVHRVLKPGGVFLSHTPAYPRLAAFSDPTHVNIITTLTFKTYFCAPYSWAKRYGFNGEFKLVSQGWDGHNLVEFLMKIPSSQ